MHYYTFITVYICLIRFILSHSSQLQCCGVDNFQDFEGAQEFKKYKNQHNPGQSIPESCCHLKDISETEKAEGLFTPIDPNCITAPTGSNSYMSKVSNYIFIYIIEF